MSKQNIFPGLYMVTSKSTTPAGRWVVTIFVGWNYVSLDVAYGSTREEAMAKGRRLAWHYKLFA